MEFALAYPAKPDAWKDIVVAEDNGFSACWFYDSPMMVRQAMCTRDEGRSLAAGLRRQAANHHKRLGLRALVVSVMEMARRDLVREETERRMQMNH